MGKTTPLPEHTSAVYVKYDRELLYFDEKNLNGRIYSKKSINLKDLKEKVSKKMLLGELGHPDTLDISLSNVSHTIEKIWEDGNKLMGTVKILQTPNGKILQSMIDNGADIVFRPRSAGTVDENGVCHVKKLFSFDAIPASKDSFKSVNTVPPLPSPPKSRIIL